MKIFNLDNNLLAIQYHNKVAIKIIMVNTKVKIQG